MVWCCSGDPLKPPIFSHIFPGKTLKTPIFLPYFGEKNSHISHIFFRYTSGLPVIGKMNAADLFDRSQLKSGPRSGASNAGAIAAMHIRVIGNKERGR